MRHNAILLAGLHALLAPAGVPSVASSFAQQTQTVQAAATPFGTRPGDIVRVWVWREPDMSGEFAVDVQGQVVLPLLGELEVAGRSGEQLSRDLRNAYARYLRNPSIQVTVLRRVAVQGQVARPGLYPVDATISIADVIALAGGIAPDGKTEEINLLRSGEVIETRLRPETILERSPVQSGDEIYVPLKSWLARNSQAFVWGAISLTTGVLLGVLVR